MTEQEPTKPHAARCACTHFVTEHQLIVNKHGTRRGACSHQDASGKCQCGGPR
jgi:hypothetical protein